MTTLVTHDSGTGRPAGSQLTFSPTGHGYGSRPGSAVRGVITDCSPGGLPGGQCGRPGSSVPGSAAATPVASVLGLRRSRLATQVANQESSMHMPM
jgi:hypothetical protein